MGFIEDYFKWQSEYEAKYGPKTIVLCQKGKFYEMYQVDAEQTIGKAKEAANLLNIQLTLSNKNKEHSPNNPYMVGFPIDYLGKYQRVLLENYYTVVIVDEIHGETITREVTNVVSPGTVLEDSRPDSNYVLCLYQENISKDKKIYCLSGIDTKSGTIILHDTNNLDDVYRFISTYYCTEILLYLVGKDLGYKDGRELISSLNLDSKLVHLKLNEIDKIIYRPAYQNAFLAKLYETKNILTPLENLNLSQQPLLSVSLILLLEFIYDHNQILLTKLQKPTIWSCPSQLILDSNSLHQLHIIPPPGRPHLETVLSTIKKTVTPIGYRLLRCRLTLPITEPKELNRRYDTIEWAIEEDRYSQLRSFLKNISDIERIHRRMAMNKLQPSEFNALDISYKSIRSLLEYLKKETPVQLSVELLLEELDQYIQKYRSIIDLNRSNVNLSSITGSIFISGIYKDIDSIDIRISKYINYIHSLQSYLNGLLVEQMGPGDYVKLLKTDKDGYYLSITETRLTKLGKLLDLQMFVSLSTGKNKKLSTMELMEANTKIDTLREELRKLVVQRYLEFIKRLLDENSRLMEILVQFVGELDLMQSLAYISVRYKYCRPSLTPRTAQIEAKELRHPIIERILIDEKYVENDLSIGGSVNGMLLFGLNGLGKTSYSRAVGTNLILAQAGMYVAASEFKYGPFRRIMTRLTTDDNLHQGKSSFNVEMIELKSILDRADDKTLVLGDEICRGTEHISGLAIIAATIKFLSEKKVNFIFATHMHSLTKLKDIQQLSNLHIYHLLAEENDGRLIYNRKLVPGNGPDLYGIEVCQYMGLPKDFISDALRIRRNFEGEGPLVPYKTSNYNQNVIVDVCLLCGKNAEHVHHIQFQKDSDVNGYIGSMHKNSKANLVALCQECHHGIHSKQIKLEGYKLTDRGIKLIEK